MLKLHFAPASRAERVLWLLEELELPYELNSMPFHPEALKSDEHRKRPVSYTHLTLPTIE